MTHPVAKPSNGGYVFLAIPGHDVPQQTGLSEDIRAPLRLQHAQLTPIVPKRSAVVWRPVQVKVLVRRDRLPETTPGSPWVAGSVGPRRRPTQGPDRGRIGPPSGREVA